MSVKQQGIVWELELPHAEAWVLMALADHADHEGENAYPGQQLLAWKTGYSQRQVKRILKALEDKGLIIPVEGTGVGQGNKQVYSLNLEAAPRKPVLKKGSKCPLKLSRERGQDVPLKEAAKGDKMSPLPAAKRGQPDAERGQNEHTKGDIFDTAPIRNARVEPSMNHPESSVCVSRARAKPPAALPDEAALPDDLTESDIVAWAREVRKDLVAPERYAARAWAGQWVNILAQVRAWKASQAAEVRSQAPDMPLEGVEVEASPMRRALFVAQGWVIEKGTSAQWHEARNSEAKLGAYADSATPATPELVARAGEFYAAQNGKGKGWRLSYLEQDWPQIYRWLKRSRTSGNGKVGAALAVPAAKPVAVVEAPSRRDAAFWEPVLRELQRITPPEMFGTWFAPLDGWLSEGRLHIHAPDQGFADWVRSNYAEPLQQALAQCGVGGRGIKWV